MTLLPEPFIETATDTMSDFDLIQVLLIGSLLAVLVWSSVEDLRHRLIPHSAVAMIAGLYIIYAVAGYADPISGLISGSIFLVIGFVLFSLNLLGGGDAKMMAAVALWAGLDSAVPLVFYTTLAGGVVALGTLIVQRIRMQDSGVAQEAVVTVPYGVAIAAGGSMVALQAA